MGNRAKPTKLKLLMGNPGHRPLNLDEPEPEYGKPDMPNWLKRFPVAKKEWDREVEILDNMGILSFAEEGDLAMRCFLAAKIQMLSREPGAKELGKIKNLITEYRQLGSLLGLDPVGRTKLRTGKPKQKSKAQSFRDRKREAK